MSTQPVRAADLADASPARHLTAMSDWSSPLALTTQHFHYDQFPERQLLMPPTYEDIITVQTSGTTDLAGRIGAPFQKHLATPGDIVLIPRGEPTLWEWTHPCSIFCLFLSPTLVAASAEEVLDVGLASIELRRQVSHKDPLVQQIALALLAEVQQGGIAGPLFTELLTSTLVVHLLRRYAVFPKAPVDVKPRLSPQELRCVTDYINDNLDKALRLHELAGLVHMSTYHFARKFKQVTGQSVYQYVIALRVAKAKRLLHEDKLTATEVSGAVGFHDLSHLNRHFKRLVGLSPSHYTALRKNVPEARKDVQSDEEKTE